MKILLLESAINRFLLFVQLFIMGWWSAELIGHEELADAIP